MQLPIPATPLVGGATSLLRPARLHAYQHRGAAPMQYALRTVSTVLIRFSVWALIAVVAWVSLPGLSALSNGGTAQPAVTHRQHAHRTADRTTPSSTRTPGRELPGTPSPPPTAATSQA
jgi:hypothetical protein